MTAGARFTLKTLNDLSPKKNSTLDVSLFKSKCDQAMNDDLNTPIVLSHLFDAVKIINSIIAKN